ncbi:hypothetical protein ABZ896_11655 [Streptomyces sp. NPDC047072]|uniref:hypothetical protein n=1 Tax=Streptomyces sp. NPDC047072 TaxID=3154809 RepID=UPI0033C8CFA2
MFQLGSFATGLVIGAVIAFVRLRQQPPWRRRVLPLSVAPASPELRAPLSLAVVQQFSDTHRFAYATVSVFERNSPETTVNLYPARGPLLDSMRLDTSRPGTATGQTARMLSGLNLPAGVMVIPLSTR